VTTLAQKIDGIAETYSSTMMGIPHDERVHLIKSAIYTGIEEALKMEPSDDVLVHMWDYGDGDIYFIRRRERYRAMRAAQWKEIEEGRE
jgi:hypothetical protein